MLWLVATEPIPDNNLVFPWNFQSFSAILLLLSLAKNQITLKFIKQFSYHLDQKNMRFFYFFIDLKTYQV